MIVYIFHILAPDSDFWCRPDWRKNLRESIHGVSSIKGPRGVCLSVLGGIYIFLRYCLWTSLFDDGTKVIPTSTKVRHVPAWSMKDLIQFVHSLFWCFDVFLLLLQRSTTRDNVLRIHEYMNILALSHDTHCEEHAKIQFI